LIIPKESCETVINVTSALVNLPNLHHHEVQGLIDRDVRNDAELATYEGQKVFSMKVAEIENLLLSEEVLCKLAASTAVDDTQSKVDEIKDALWEQFDQDIERQTAIRARAEVTFRLCGFGTKDKTEEGLVTAFEQHTSSINAREIYMQSDELLKKVSKQRNFDELLMYFNDKGALNTAAQKLGLSRPAYEKMARAVIVNLRQEEPFPLQRFIPEGLKV
jgi:hypothetical protein